jgi:hypothetical protein
MHKELIRILARGFYTLKHILSEIIEIEPTTLLFK